MYIKNLLLKTRVFLVFWCFHFFPAQDFLEYFKLF